MRPYHTYNTFINVGTIFGTTIRNITAWFVGLKLILLTLLYKGRNNKQYKHFLNSQTVKDAHHFLVKIVLSRICNNEKRRCTSTSFTLIHQTSQNKCPQNRTSIKWNYNSLTTYIYMNEFKIIQHIIHFREVEYTQIFLLVSTILLLFSKMNLNKNKMLFLRTDLFTE